MLTLKLRLTRFLLCVAATCLTACAGNEAGLQRLDSTADNASAAPAAGQPAAPVSGRRIPVVTPHTGTLLDLPAPSALLKLLPPDRNASFTPAEGHKDGNEYNGALGLNRVSPAGSAATFDPDFASGSSSGLAGVAYCVYDFLLPDPSGSCLADFNWGVAPGDGLWFAGLANFTADRWDWYAGPVSHQLSIATLADYLNGEDFFLAVAVLGQDDAGLTELQLTGVELPLAQLLADTGAGLAPLDVNFDASGSNDPDGTIVDFEWDFDGDGQFNEPGAEDTARGSAVPATYTYNTAGDYAATVRVTDNDGASDAAQLVIAVNAAPTVNLSADVNEGLPPLEVTFIAAVGDSNGTIADIEWDFDGDALFNETGPEQDARDDATPPAYTFSSPGSFNTTVRVTDDDGAQVSDSELVNVGSPPSVELTSDVDSGPKPLAVTFTANASDPGGSITDIEWDFDGDLTYNEVGNGESTAQGNATPPAFVYTATGTITAHVRVTDDDAGTALDSLDITVTNTAPNAVLQVDFSEGDAPLSVQFDATASNDPGGTVEDYEWDFNANGVFNEAGNGELAARGDATPSTYTYTKAGYRSPAVRVTDDNGATDTASLLITVHGWAVLTIDSAGQSGYYPSLALIDGKPAVAFQRNDPLGGIRYAIASTATGSSAADWTVVDAVDGMSANPVGICLASVNNIPAISYKDQSDTSLHLARASSATGDTAASWDNGTNLQLDNTGDEGEYTSLIIVNGNPAICYPGASVMGDTSTALKYRRSSTANGSALADWSTLVVIDNPDPLSTGFYCSMEIINGNPAISYQNTSNGDLRYTRSSDGNGSTWPAGNRFNVDTSGRTYSGYGELAVVNGNPAIIGRRSDDLELRYLRANTVTGDSQAAWTASTNVPAETTLFVGEYASLAFISGFPCIAFGDTTDYDLFYLKADSADGGTQASWDNGDQVTLDGPTSVNQGISMVDNNGKPAIAYTEISGMNLKFATLI